LYYHAYIVCLSYPYIRVYRLYDITGYCDHKSCYPGCRQAEEMSSDKWFIWYELPETQKQPVGNLVKIWEILQKRFKVQFRW